MICFVKNDIFEEDFCSENDIFEGDFFLEKMTFLNAAICLENEMLDFLEIIYFFIPIGLCM